MQGWGGSAGGQARPLVKGTLRKVLTEGQAAQSRPPQELGRSPTGVWGSLPAPHSSSPSLSAWSLPQQQPPLLRPSQISRVGSSHLLDPWVPGSGAASGTRPQPENHKGPAREGMCEQAADPSPAHRRPLSGVPGLEGSLGKSPPP